MRFTRLALFGISCLGLPLAAQADRVHLHDGAVLEGKATTEGDKVVLEVEGGRVALPARSVARIEHAPTALDDYRRRRAAIADGDVKGLLALAAFCRAHHLPSSEREVLQAVLEVAPDHPVARARLGYIKTREGWVSRERLRAEEAERRAAAKPAADQQVQLEIAELQAEAARHARDRAALELEIKQRELLTGGQPDASDAPQVIGAAPVWIVPEGPHRRRPCGEDCRPRPAQAPPFGINGVRHPSDPTFSLPGVRDPRSSFDGRL